MEGGEEGEKEGGREGRASGAPSARQLLNLIIIASAILGTSNLGLVQDNDRICKKE